MSEMKNMKQSVQYVFEMSYTYKKVLSLNYEHVELLHTV